MTGARRRAHLAEIWKDPDATLLKAADRLSNIRDVVAQGDPAFTRRYLRKTRREILGTGSPLAAHPVAGSAAARRPGGGRPRRAGRC